MDIPNRQSSCQQRWETSATNDRPEWRLRLVNSLTHRPQTVHRISNACYIAL
jgi:hypothetical protein